MKEYIGLLSMIYIIIIIIKLRDNKKSFENYIEEYKEIKFQLKLVGQKKNPFIMIKFTNAIFYFLLFLYYMGNAVLFDNYPLVDLLSYALILLTLFKFSRKLTINSVDDFESRIKYNKNDYQKKQKISLCLGLIEFAYAFNALSLVSFYY